MNKELKIKNSGVFLAAIMLLCVSTQFFSYGGNTGLAPLLRTIDGYDYYSLFASLGSAGSMISLPAVGARLR